MDSDRSSIICNPFSTDIFCKMIKKIWWRLKMVADKVEQWVQCEANKQQSKWEVGRTKHLLLGEFATKLDEESKSNGNRAIWRHICEQVARRPWERRIWGKVSVPKPRHYCYKDASHYLHFPHCSHSLSGQTSIGPFYNYISQRVDQHLKLTFEYKKIIWNCK